MSPSPRPFVSLPEVVLREILGYVLVDTPCKPNRAAILRTCSTLHELGISLLYRVVDLRGYATSEANLSAWINLFNPGGLLASDGRVEGMNESVRELRIGGVQALGGLMDLLEFGFEGVQLPQCITLVLDRSYLPLYRPPHNPVPTLPLEKWVVTLPVVHLIVNVILYGHPSFTNSKTYGLSDFSTLLADQPWDNLQSVRMRGAFLWCDSFASEPSRIAFSSWRFKTLSIEVPEVVTDASCLYRALLEPEERVESDVWWRGLERIELSASSVVEAEFRRRLDGTIKAGPLARLQRRILPMVVFVDEEGTERRLIEAEKDV